MQLFKKKRAEPDIESMRQTVRRNGRTLFDHGTGDADGAYEMKRNAERDNLLDVFHPGAAKPSYNILVLAPMRQGDPVTFRCSCWSWRNEHRESKAGWCKHTLGAERLYALAKDVVGGH